MMLPKPKSCGRFDPGISRIAYAIRSLDALTSSKQS
jgi:hypothetical protein